MNNMKQTQDDKTIQPFNCSTIQRVKAYAFTLAETLIVIGIIGVVAALTLPNLNHATGDKEKVTKVKKIYSSLTEAFDRAQAIYGSSDEWCKSLNIASCTEQFAKRITEFMKVSKVCGHDEGCFLNSKLLDFNGDIYNDNYLQDLQNENAYMFILSDGISLSFKSDSYGLIILDVDLDGPNKGKNQLGYDFFNFMIIANHNELSAGEPIGSYNENEDTLVNYIKGNYLAAWVLEFGNLDYLKCPDDIVDGRTSCN